MKHLFTVLLVASSEVCFAQGNLQFNQVLNFDYELVTGAGASGQVAGVLTVPAGKVWKITSASTSESGTVDFERTLQVNNHVLYERRQNAQISMNTPYWLSTGNHTVEMFGGARIASLSVVEFNVIP